MRICYLLFDCRLNVCRYALVSRSRRDKSRLAPTEDSKLSIAEDRKPLAADDRKRKAPSRSPSEERDGRSSKKTARASKDALSVPSSSVVLLLMLFPLVLRLLFVLNKKGRTRKEVLASG